MGEVVVIVGGGATVVDEADAARVLGMPNARPATAEEAEAFLAARGGAGGASTPAPVAEANETATPEAAQEGE